MDDPTLAVAILGLIVLGGGLAWCVWWALRGVNAGLVDQNALMTIATYDQPDQAYLDRALLESNGIRVFIADEGAVGVDWFLSNAVGGVKLQVPYAEAQDARTILADHELGGSPAPEARPLIDGTRVASGMSPASGESEEPVVCLRCGSDNVYRTRRHRKWAYASLLLLSFPIPATGVAYQCDGCGFRWKKPLFGATKQDDS